MAGTLRRLYESGNRNIDPGVGKKVLVSCWNPAMAMRAKMICSLEFDQAVRHVIGLAGRGREMPPEHGPKITNRRLQCCSYLASTCRGGEGVDDALPLGGPHQGIDAMIGDDLDLTLGQRHQQQHTVMGGQRA